MSDDGEARSWPQRCVPPLIDVAMVAGVLFLVPWLGARLFDDSATNYYFLIPGFVAILAGIIAIRQLPNYSLDESEGPSFFALCLIFFLMVTYSLLFAHGTNLGGSEQENDGVAVISFFIFLLPVLGSFFLPLKRAEPGTGKALAVEAIGLLSVNYLTLIGAAVWHRFSSLPPSKDPVYATGISFCVLYLILYLLFLAFFGLPRIYLLRATGDRIGLAIYLLGVAVFLWDKVPAVN